MTKDMRDLEHSWQRKENLHRAVELERWKREDAQNDRNDPLEEFQEILQESGAGKFQKGL